AGAGRRHRPRPAVRATAGRHSQRRADAVQRAGRRHHGVAAHPAAPARRAAAGGRLRAAGGRRPRVPQPAAGDRHRLRPYGHRGGRRPGGAEQRRRAPARPGVPRPEHADDGRRRGAVRATPEPRPAAGAGGAGDLGRPGRHRSDRVRARRRPAAQGAGIGGVGATGPARGDGGGAAMTSNPVTAGRSTVAANILVVDDMPASRYITASWLRRSGHLVTEATTGAEALSAVAARDFDLVLLDVHLPDMSGFEVCERIKADERTSALPVIHVSATYVDAEHKAQGLTRGADAYLT